jgi:hypothetical protein
MSPSETKPKRRRPGKKPVDPIAVLEAIAADPAAPAAARVSAAGKLLRHNLAVAKAAAKEPVAPKATAENVIHWRKHV